MIASTRPAPHQLPSKAISEGLNLAIPDAPTLANLKSVTEKFSKGLSKAEKRAFRKVVRNKFKKIRSEYRKELQSNKETNQDASKNWAAYTGFVLGILAVLGFIIPGTVLLSIPGLVFSIVGEKSEKKTLATVGLALNMLMVVLLILAVIIVASGGFGY